MPPPEETGKLNFCKPGGKQKLFEKEARQLYAREMSAGNWYK